jgi:hypothetical protein
MVPQHFLDEVFVNYVIAKSGRHVVVVAAVTVVVDLLLFESQLDLRLLLFTMIV